MDHIKLMSEVPGSRDVHYFENAVGREVLRWRVEVDSMDEDLV